MKRMERGSDEYWKYMAIARRHYDKPPHGMRETSTDDEMSLESYAETLRDDDLKREKLEADTKQWVADRDRRAREKEERRKKKKRDVKR